MENTRAWLLVAIRDTDTFAAALTYAAQRALEQKLGLHLVHVTHSPDGLAGTETMWVSLVKARPMARQLLAQAAEAAESLTGGRVPITTALSDGAVVPVIEELAASCAGVVVQHRPRGRFAGGLGGSVAMGLAAHSPVPVTSVPDGWEPRGLDHPARIAVGIGDPETVDYLLPHALDVASTRGGGLTVVHAWDVPMAYEGALVSPDELRDWNQRQNSELERLDSTWIEKYPDVDTELQVRRGDTVGVLLDAYRAHELVIVGRHRGRFVKHRLGSVARALIRYATGPVEVVPPPGPTTVQVA